MALHLTRRSPALPPVTRALINPYRKIGLIEYDRTWAGDTGRQQAIVPRVDKRSVKTTLAMLEARTGRTVRFRDEDARKALHG